MAGTAFWSVELGGGMGPLVLGLPRNEIFGILRDQSRGEIDREELDELLELEDNEFYIDAIETNLFFSNDAQQTLKRLDIADDRVAFGSMRILGKPLHEVVTLLNVPASETLWCDFYEDNEQADAAHKNLHRNQIVSCWLQGRFGLHRLDLD